MEIVLTIVIIHDHVIMIRVINIEYYKCIMGRRKILMIELIN